MKNRTLGRKILLSILIIVIIISAVLIYINWLFKPLPENKRNISTSNVKILVDIDDWRTPIIRTYTKKEYDNFSDNKFNKIKNIVDGNIEGDVPALKIKDGLGILKVSIEKVEKINEGEIVTQIIPNNIPKIKISILPTLYSREEAKEINGLLIKDDREGIYLYEIKRYLNQGEIYHNENDDFFMESMFVEINYEINNESYVSIFAINTIEYKD